MEAGTVEQLLRELAERAPHYVPEWRYNLSSPDAGAALVQLWADMFSGTLERFRRLPENYRRSLLDITGSEPKPAESARGFLTFIPRPDADEPVLIPAGTGVACPSVPGAVLETDRDLSVSPTALTAMYYASPACDVVRLYDSFEQQTLFQTEPAAPHIWTLYHPFAFDVSPQALLRLEIRLSEDETDRLRYEAEWEFEDGTEWKPLTVQPDGGKFLLCLEKEEACRRIRFHLRGGKASSTKILSVLAFPSGSALPAEAVYAGDTQQESARFYPFGERFIPGLCFYIACGDALSKPGAFVGLSFNLSFEDFPIEGYPVPAVHMKKIMKASDLAPLETYEITVSEVLWEYYNGTGWAALALKEPGLFADGMARRCSLTFICPEDVRPALCGAHEALFIRARILKADNLFRMHGHYRTPVISDPVFRYGYPDGVPILEAEVSEHMDTHTERLDTPVSLVGALPNPGAMYFAFDRPFSQGTFLLILESTHPSSLRWEYLSVNGWSVLDTRDGTEGLSKPGLLFWQTPDPCTSLRLFGREAYWMRLCDTEGRFETVTDSGPRLLRFCQNTVTAVARTPGSASNLPPGSFRSPVFPITGIVGANNPLAVYGGTDTEAEDLTLQRLTARFTHGDRAVSPRDYEMLALEASRQLCRVRFYPNTDENGVVAPGCGCLVILRRDAGQGGFEALRTEVLAYVNQRRPLGMGRLCVSKPCFIAVSVTLRAAIADPDAALTVKHHILEALEQYLDPVHGGPHGGWHIGSLPEPDELNALIRAVPGILWISHMETVYLRDTMTADYRRAVTEPFVLPRNGAHQIFLRC